MLPGQNDGSSAKNTVDHNGRLVHDSLPSLLKTVVTPLNQARILICWLCPEGGTQHYGPNSRPGLGTSDGRRLIDRG